MAEVLETLNKEYGFYGTTRQNYPPTQTEKRWAETFTTLKELSNLQDEVVRRFLDSKAGRHLADNCYDKDDVVNIVKTQWQCKDFRIEIYRREYKVSDEEFYNN